MSEQDPARIAALDALLRLWTEGGILEETEFSKLPANTRARAMRLTRETIREEAGFDFIIKKFAKRKPALAVRAVLHLGFYELIVEKAATHGAVHNWVEIAKSRSDTVHASGFINAQLRKAADDLPKLNPTNQYGKALRAHLMTQYSSSTLDQINKLQSVPASVDLRLRRHLNLEEWAKKLDGVPISRAHAIRLNTAKTISARPGFKEGAWWVQDVAATLAADLFDDIAGKTVLDLCAAPGGKTMQLADRGAKVSALDISAPRMKRLEANLERTNLEAHLIVKNALKFEPAAPFNAILLDAPCSATGTIRRHPDLRFDQPLQRMESLSKLQLQLLHKAFAMLKEGGELIYVVCSLLQEEGEMQIERFLQEEKQAHIQPIIHPWHGQTQNHLRILPTDSTALDIEGGCDGFFIAKIRKS